jgi:hypothetical protein
MIIDISAERNRGKTKSKGVHLSERQIFSRRMGHTETAALRGVSLLGKATFYGSAA